MGKEKKKGTLARYIEVARVIYPRFRSAPRDPRAAHVRTIFNAQQDCYVCTTPPGLNFLIPRTGPFSINISLLAPVPASHVTRASQYREVVSDRDPARPRSLFLPSPEEATLVLRVGHGVAPSRGEKRDGRSDARLTRADVTECCARGSGFPCVRAGRIFPPRGRASLPSARGGYALNSSRSRQRSRRSIDDDDDGRRGAGRAYVFDRFGNRARSETRPRHRTIFLLTNISRGVPRHLPSAARNSVPAFDGGGAGGGER